MITLRLLFVVLFLLWTAPAWAESASFELPGEASLEKLRSGGWIVESDPVADSWASASVVIFIPAPLELIWNTIINCKDAFVFVDGLEYCEVLEESGDFARTRQIVDKGWAVPELEFTFETRRDPYRRMEFNMTEGNLKVMKGSWDFRQLDDGALVRYILILQPLLPAPHWLVRRNMKKDLPDMLRCIRGLVVEGPASEALIKDRQQCPGEMPKS